MFIQIGSTLQTMPMGRIGTVTDMWMRKYQPVGTWGVDEISMITLKFADGTEDDFEEEELRQV